MACAIMRAEPGCPAAQFSCRSAFPFFPQCTTPATNMANMHISCGADASAHSGPPVAVQTHMEDEACTCCPSSVSDAAEAEHGDADENEHCENLV